MERIEGLIVGRGDCLGEVYTNICAIYVLSLDINIAIMFYITTRHKYNKLMVNKNILYENSVIMKDFIMRETVDVQ